MRRFLTAVIQRVSWRRSGGNSAGGGDAPWMAGFGALSDLADENRRVLESIEKEHERLSPEDTA